MDHMLKKILIFLLFLHVKGQNSNYQIFITYPLHESNPMFVFQGSLKFVLVLERIDAKHKAELITFHLPQNIDNSLHSDCNDTVCSIIGSFRIDSQNLHFPSKNAANLSQDLKAIECLINWENHFEKAQKNENLRLKCDYIPLENSTKRYRNIDATVSVNTQNGNLLIKNQNYAVKNVSFGCAKDNLELHLWPPFGILTLEAPFRLQILWANLHIKAISLSENSTTTQNNRTNFTLDNYHWGPQYCPMEENLMLKNSSDINLIMDPQDENNQLFQVNQTVTIQANSLSNLSNIYNDNYKNYGENITNSTTQSPFTTIIPVPDNPILPPSSVPPLSTWVIYYPSSKIMTRSHNILHDSYHQNATDDFKHACFVLESSLALDIQYGFIVPIINQNGTNTSYVVQNKTVRIAVPGYDRNKTQHTLPNGVHVRGKCNVKANIFSPYPFASQELSITFPVNNIRWQLNFSIENVNQSVPSQNFTIKEPFYRLQSMNLRYNTESFDDAVHPAEIYISLPDNTAIVKANGPVVGNEFLGSPHANTTLICISHTQLVLNANVSLHAYGLKFHPFIPYNYSANIPPKYINGSAREPNSTILDPHAYFFNQLWICRADRFISDVVPIAVGSALALLIVCVLVAYILGRRRISASNSYENAGDLDGGTSNSGNPNSLWKRFKRVVKSGTSEEPGTYQPIE